MTMCLRFKSERERETRAKERVYKHKTNKLGQNEWVMTAERRRRNNIVESISKSMAPKLQDRGKRET